MKNQQSKRCNKKPDCNSTKFTCFGCGKQGHMKVDCPSLVNKEKARERKSNKSGKGRKAYIAGKTMPLVLAVLHMRMLKLICVLWLERI